MEMGRRTRDSLGRQHEKEVANVAWTRVMTADTDSSEDTGAGVARHNRLRNSSKILQPQPRCQRC